MAEVVVFDVVEDILIRLDVKDLLRCKSVCKLWQSLILSSRFVKSHLNHANNKDNSNNEIGHRRIIMPYIPGMTEIMWYYYHTWQIVGSSNGLVCISPVDAQVLVTNPSTREVKPLPTPPIPNIHRCNLCWGFGYDPSIDDYKVVVGIKKGSKRTCFQVLALKSDIWKPIGHVKGRCTSPFGTFHNGALHWIIDDYYSRKKVILYFDLSLEEFKEIPQPDDAIIYGDLNYRLGVFQECLCIIHGLQLPKNIWVMRNYNVKQSWELLPYDCLYKSTTGFIQHDFEIYGRSSDSTKHDVVHTLTHNTRHKSFLCDDNTRFSETTEYMSAPSYVESLVSPHVNGGSKQISDNRSVQAGSINSISGSFFFSPTVLKRKRSILGK